MSVFKSIIYYKMQIYKCTKFIYTYMYIHTYIHTYIYTWLPDTLLLRVPDNLVSFLYHSGIYYIYIYICYIYIYIYIYINRHRYKYRYILTYTHIYTYTLYIHTYNMQCIYIFLTKTLLWLGWQKKSINIALFSLWYN